MLKDFAPELFSSPHSLSLVSGNKELLALYYNKLFTHEALTRTFMGHLEGSKQQAARLISFIKKEYSLE